MRRFWRSRKAVSDMMGGVIVIALFLTALVSMVVVTQQYDTYQNVVSGMSQKDIDRLSENLTVLYPGLLGNIIVSGCGSKCNQYNMSLSNDGGIAVQIVRIYVNSTGSTGCTTAAGLCVLNAANGQTPTAYTFNPSDALVNTGELNHTVRFWLPQTIGALPNPVLTPSNTIWIVTARGRIFTFQWPFAPVGPQGGQGSNPTIQTGLMKIAYNSSTYSSATDSCHTEPRENWAAGGGKTLAFVNPWISDAGMSTMTFAGTFPPSTTTLFVYVNTINSLTYPVTISWGSMILLVATSGANAKEYFLGGSLAGVVYPITPAPGVFTPYGTQVTIKPGDQFIMIFKMYQDNGWITGGSFSGTATVNNANPPGYAGAGGFGWAEDNSFRAISIYCDGLYVRSSC